MRKALLLLTYSVDHHNTALLPPGISPVDVIMDVVIVLINFIPTQKNE